MREDIVSRAVPATSRAGGAIGTPSGDEGLSGQRMPVASRRRRKLSETSGDGAGSRRVRGRVSSVEVEPAGGAVAMLTGGRGRGLRPRGSRSVSFRCRLEGGQLRVSYVSEWSQGGGSEVKRRAGDRGAEAEQGVARRPPGRARHGERLCRESGCSLGLAALVSCGRCRAPSLVRI